jgi:hypothetical protein
VIETTRTGSVGLDPMAATEMLCRVSDQRGFQVARVAPNQVDIRRGSQGAFRAKGAFFAKTHEVPVVAAVRFDAGADGSVARISCCDDLGFGIRIGATKLMTRAVEEFADVIQLLASGAALSLMDQDGSPRLEARLAPPKGSASVSPLAGDPERNTSECSSGHSNRLEARFCVTCGSPLESFG